MDAVAEISGLIEDTVSAQGSIQGQNEISMTDNQIEAMFQGQHNNAIDETSRSVKLKDLLLGKFKKVTFSPSLMTRMTEATLDNQDLTSTVATAMKKRTAKAVSADSKRGIQRRNFIKAAYSTAHRLYRQATSTQRTSSTNEQKRRHTRNCQKNRQPSYRYGTK